MVSGNFNAGDGERIRLGNSADFQIYHDGSNSYIQDTGTGTLNLAGAVTGFITFVSGIATGNTTYYTIFEQGTANFEVGIGTVTDATPDTLSRDTVLSNSLGNTSKINFNSGGSSTLDVFCTMPASKSVYLDATGTPVGAASAGFALAMAVAL